MKNCPICKEAVPHQSTICMHCGVDMPPQNYSTLEMDSQKYLQKLQHADGWRKYLMIGIFIVLGFWFLIFILDLFI